MTPFLLQLLFEGRSHRHAVHHRVYSHTGKGFLLFQRNAQALERVENLIRHLVEAFVARLLLRRREVAHVLEVGLHVVEMGPTRVLALVFQQRLDVAECFQTPFQQPFWLVFALGDVADNVFAKALREGFGLDVRVPTMFVLLVGYTFEIFGFGGTHKASEYVVVQGARGRMARILQKCKRWFTLGALGVNTGLQHACR